LLSHNINIPIIIPIPINMINVASLLYLVFLFYVLSPNVLLRIPPNGSKHVVALVHAVVFAVVYYYTSGYVGAMLGSL
jgi:hypothetical protein